MEFTTSKVTAYLNDEKSAFVVFKDKPDLGTQIDLAGLKGPKEMASFLSRVITEVSGVTIDGEDTTQNDILSWPMELVTAIMQAYTARLVEVADATRSSKLDEAEKN